MKAHTWRSGEAEGNALPAAPDDSRPALPSDATRAVFVDAFLVLAGMAIAAFLAYPELINRLPDLNDNVLHRGIVEGMVKAIRAGEDPTDLWLSGWVFGSSMLHFYPFLGHLLTALPVLLTGGAISVLQSLRFCTWALLSLMPGSMYILMRAWPIPRPGPALAAIATALVAAGGLYGLSFETYTWSGYGLYPQLWGATLGPVAAAAGLRAVRTGRNVIVSGIFLGLVGLCHPLFGYVAAATVVLASLVVNRPAIWTRIAYFAAAAVATALPLLVPWVLDRAFTGFSMWDEAWRRDSWGWKFVIGRLATGRILDDGRPPFLSAVAMVGGVVAVRRLLGGKNRNVLVRANRDSGTGQLLLLISLAIWTLAYVGRAGLGQLVDLLPLASGLHLHRMVVGVQWSLLGLFGVGGTLGWNALKWSRSWTRTSMAIALTVMCLLPAIRERIRYSQLSETWASRTKEAFAGQPDFHQIVARLRTLPPGRIYAGPTSGWGGELKIGFVPVYAALSCLGFDVVSYIYTFSMASDILPAFDPTRLGHFDLTNTRYLVSGADRRFAGLKLIMANGQYRLWEASTTGYLGVSDATEVWRASVEDRRQGGQAVARAAIHASEQWMRSAYSETGQIWLMEPPRGRRPSEAERTLPSPGAGRPGQVEEEMTGVNSYSGKVVLQRDGFVVLKCSYDPHWHATLDGAPVPTYFVTPGFVALRAGAGSHRVVFRYHYRRSLLFLVSVPVLGILGWIRLRRADPTTE